MKTFTAVLFLALLVPGPAPAGIDVVATVFPYYEMARAVGADRADVRLLLPPGANPHKWSPRPGQIRHLLKARIVIFTDYALEPWMKDVLKAREGTSSFTVLRAADGVIPVNQAHGHRGGDNSGHGSGHDYDPHVWLDFQADQQLVRRIVQAMSRAEPRNSAFFKANGRAYIDRLRRLDAAYEKGLAGCKRRTFIVAGHGAFGYLARAYGLEQIPVMGIAADALPTPGRMAQVVDSLKKQGAGVIFFDPASSPRIARVLAKETGARILGISPGASLTRDQIARHSGFLDLMYQNLKVLRTGLGCGTL